MAFVALKRGSALLWGFHCVRFCGVYVFTARTRRRTALRSCADSAREVVTFEDLLERSDFVSVQCPLNAGTKGLVGAEALARMKPTAYLINTARGSIVDQDALVRTGSWRGHFVSKDIDYSMPGDFFLQRRLVQTPAPCRAR